MSPPASGDDLECLAGSAGIEPAYHDYFGRPTIVSVQTKRALLAAMGFGVDSAADLRAARSALAEAPWRRVLEPVVVVLRGQPVIASLTLPVAARNRTIEWQVFEENGRRHEGRAGVDSLPFVARTTVDRRRFERRALALRLTLPPGYHQLAIGDARCRLIVAPLTCYLSPIASRVKTWGIGTQLYSLRSRRNWGIGDFTDLANLARAARRAGASTVGLNPLHELDPSAPDACSPYSPSSRLLLNVEYLDVEAIEDFAESAQARRTVAAAGFARRLAALRAMPLIDYGAVWALKKPVLETLYQSFRRKHVQAGSSRARRFGAFVEHGGQTLARLCAFEALAEHFAAKYGRGWLEWPNAFRDPSSPAVRAFVAEHRDRVAFFAYLQWNAQLQLSRAAAACGAMPFGLYRDLAVGAEPRGAEAWSDAQLFPRGISIGAPPDPLNVHGQNWNLVPLAPLALRERGYEPFVQLLRANMRDAGALRIDHAMGLARLFWIPAGRPPAEGAYVRYPFDDLLAIVALESTRNRCTIVGEDLGTVPEGFRERMHAVRAFSSRLLYFERTPTGAFVAPRAYPALSLATAGTHDLPTLWSFWTGRDVVLRSGLGLLPADGSIETTLLERRAEIEALIDALVKHGGLAAATAARLRVPAEPSASDLAAGVAAVYRYLARSRARLVVVSLEDALGVVDQVNVPGTIAQHPNWRRRLPVDLEELQRDRSFAAVTQALRAVRGRRAARPSPRPR